jgi:ribonuclease-3
MVMKTIIPKTEIEFDGDILKKVFILQNSKQSSVELVTDNNVSNDDFLFEEHLTPIEIEQILQKVMNIRIRSPIWYQRAFVHKSVLRLHKSLSEEQQKRVPEYMKESNERLEFQGDAVLGLCVADYLLERYPDADEGIITVYRTRIVKGDTLTMFAEKLGLQHKLLMSQQTRKTSGNKHSNLLENTFEALIGAIYNDQGLEIARRFIILCILKYFDLDNLERDDNYKDILLRMTQQLKLTCPQYEKILETGKPNQKEFTVVVYINGKRFGKGFGNMIKNAEQNAEKNAIERLR